MLSVAAVLAFTGAAKLLSVAGTARILNVEDPLVGIRFRYLLLAVGMVELGIAVVCLARRWQTPAILLVAWLATGFLFYRLGLWLTHWHRPCTCLGNLAGALHLSDQMADNVMKGVLVYLLVGSYLALALRYRAERLVRASATGALPAA
jgi:hypothetical protein